MTLRGYPLPLLGMAFFVALLSVNFTIDIPLGVFVLSVLLCEPPKNSSLPAAQKRHYLLPFLFVVGSGLSALLSQDPAHSLLIVASLLPGLFCYVVLSIYGLSERNRRIIYFSLGLLAISILLSVSVGRVLASDQSSISQIQNSKNLILVVPNDILVLAIICPLLLCLWNSQGFLLRLLIMTIWVASIWFAIVLASRQATLLLILAAVLIALMTSPRKLLPLIVIFSLLALLWEAHRGWLLLAKVSEFSRWYVWHTGWEMFKQFPVLGVGPGGFKDLYAEYLSKLGYVFSELPDQRVMPWIHNLYLEQLVERGVIGAILFASILYTGSKRLWNRMVVASEPVTLELKAIFVAWVIFLLGSVAELTLQRLWVSVILFVLMGLQYAATRNS